MLNDWRIDGQTDWLTKWVIESNNATIHHQHQQWCTPRGLLISSIPTLKLKERLSSHHQARYKICMYAKRNKPWAYVSRPRMWMSVCLSVCSVPSVVIWHEGGCQMRRQDKWNGLCRKERKGKNIFACAFFHFRLQYPFPCGFQLSLYPQLV